MRIYCILLALLSLSCTALAQGNGLSLKHFKSKPTLADQFGPLQERYSGLSFSLGYEHMGFLNPVYANNLDKERIKYKLGYYFSARIIIYPVSLDINRFNADFDTKNLSSWTEEGSTFHHRGWEYLLSVYPMFFGKAARTFAPYGGIGYQFSHVCWNCQAAIEAEENRDPEVKVYTVNTSAPVWKSGMLIRFGKFYFEGEYKQTFSLKNRFSSGTWRVGFGAFIGAYGE